MEWLVPLGLFWTLSAIYLGGWSIELVGGGGLRQVLGVVIAFVLFVAVWGVLRMILSGLGPIFFGVIVPTAITTLLLPLLFRAAYFPMGIRIEKGAQAH